MIPLYTAPSGVGPVLCPVRTAPGRAIPLCLRQPLGTSLGTCGGSVAALSWRGTLNQPADAAETGRGLDVRGESQRQPDVE